MLPIASGAPQDAHSKKMVAAWAAMPRRISGAIEKSEEWLAVDDAAAALGTTKETANFRRTWQTLLSAATANEPTVAHGVVVRMAACRINGVDRWCVHRDDIAGLGPHVQRRERRWPTRPEGWLTLEEAAERTKDRVDPDVYADAWRALTKGTAFEGFARIAGLDIQLKRGHVYRTERWFIHPDDVSRLALALRDRLPHLRKGYLTPDDAAAGLQRDARELARNLMSSMGQTKALTGTATLMGEPVEMRRFLVNGQATFCLAKSELPRFHKAVTDLYDEILLVEVGLAP